MDRFRFTRLDSEKMSDRDRFVYLFNIHSLAMKESMVLFFAILKCILDAARAGTSILPRLSILLMFQIFLHVGLVQFGIDNKTRISFWLIVASVISNLVGYVFLILLYRHSIQTIFNRQIPKTIMECLPSFAAHLSMLRPLGIIFRYCTSSWRVLPDIIVLGEVRCGTTSFCQHLADLENFNCHTPFCLWAHPELDKKETFYFVGHYLGYVTPRHYRMCFPLKITRWWSEIWNRIKGNSPRPFVAFDGCAQYLTSPTAPFLIAETYRQAGQPPPILISCVRDPFKQALSWWKYENAAMDWGSGMGLTSWNVSLRGPNYPPKSMEEAINFSHSPFVQDCYQRAETLYSLSGLKAKSQSNQRVKIPNWAMTWPAGQLGVIGRNSKFAQHIARYELIFHECFGGHTDSPHHLQYINILPLEYLGNERLLKDFLVTVFKKVAKRNSTKRNEVETAFEKAIVKFQSSALLPTVHRNSGSNSSNVSDINTSSIQQKFDQDRKDLNHLLGVNQVGINYKSKLL